MSDSMIDQWLAFKRKMSDMRAVQQQHNADPVHSDEDNLPELTLDACTVKHRIFPSDDVQEADGAIWTGACCIPTKSDGTYVQSYI